jgi:hypothetical protein
MGSIPKGRTLLTMEESRKPTKHINLGLEDMDRRRSASISGAFAFKVNWKIFVVSPASSWTQLHAESALLD